VRARGRSALVYESIGKISDIRLYNKDRGRDLDLVDNKIAHRGELVYSSLGQQLALYRRVKNQRLYSSTLRLFQEKRLLDGLWVVFELKLTVYRASFCLPLKSAPRRTRRTLQSTNFTELCVCPVGKKLDTLVVALR
jgi:hypothetical protein